MEELNPEQVSQPKFIFRKERDLGEIISDTFSFFAQNRKALLNILLKYVAPFLLVTIIFSVFYQYKTGDMLTDITVISSNPDGFLNVFAENIFVMLLFLVSTLATYVVLYATIIHSIKSYIDNNGQIIEQDVSDGLKKNFLPITGFLLLSGLVMVVGFILCILPGIYFWVVLTPGVVMLIIEGKSIGDTFSKCFTIIKENWWMTFATLLVFSILINILGFVFDLPLTIYAFIEGFTGFDQQAINSEENFGELYQNWIYLLFAAISVLGQFFLGIFTVIMTALVYFNLSEKQDFTGTYEQIDNIGN